MTNSIKISPQRTSFILSVSVILYWATDSYLYLSCHINLMEYSTPAILYITAMILACGVLQRFFFRFITKNELGLSFGKQVRPLPEQIKEINPECPKDKDINPENLVVKHDYMDNYEVRIAEIERKKAERQADIKRVIHEYTTFVMTASVYKIEAKGKDLCEVQFFGKFIMCSNNEDTPVLIEPGETRYWVRKINPLKK